MLRNRVEYLILLWGVLAFYLFFSGYLSFLLLVCYVSLPFFSLVFTAFSGQADLFLLTEKGTVARGEKFRVKIKTVGAPGVFGIRGKVKIRIRNQFSGESVKKTICFSMYRERKSMDFYLRSSCCGLLHCEIEEVKFYDPLWLAGFRRKSAAGNSLSVLVMPDLGSFSENVERRIFENPDGNEYDESRPGDDVSELYEIREFRDGDRISRIHWKMPGKKGEIYVKEGSRPLDQKPLLVADTAGEDGEKAETVVENAFSLSALLAERGICHRFGIFLGTGEGSFSVFTVNGPGDFYEMLCGILSVGRTLYRDRTPFIRCVLEERKISELFYFCTGLSEKEAYLLCGEADASRFHIYEVIGEKKDPVTQEGKYTAEMLGAEWKELKIRKSL